jgi:hypothetical protein
MEYFKPFKCEGKRRKKEGYREDSASTFITGETIENFTAMKVHK